MSLLNFASYVTSGGYKEIQEDDCPIIFKRIEIGRKSLYFKKDDKYAMCAEDGNFVIWNDKIEHDELLSWKRPIYSVIENKNYKEE